MTLALRVGAELPGGRLETWAEPREDRLYALGVDFAYGLAGGDLDAAVLLDDHGEQVAELEGRWGERFVDHLLPLIRYYSAARVFIVGEATATGTIILRQLYRAGCWLYFRRDDARRGTPVTDVLGHAPGRHDITVHKLRQALAGGPRGGAQPVVVHSQRLWEQLCAFRWLPRRAGMSMDAEQPDQLAFRDADLRMGAPDGQHDDLVRAAALACAGLEWLPHYPAPRQRLPEQSIGHKLGYDRDDDDEQDP